MRPMPLRPCMCHSILLSVWSVSGSPGLWGSTCSPQTRFQMGKEAGWSVSEAALPFSSPVCCFLLRVK